MSNPSEVMGAFNECVESLIEASRKLMQEHIKDKDPEKAFHLNKLIRKWFAQGGVL